MSFICGFAKVAFDAFIQETVTETDCHLLVVVRQVYCVVEVL